MMVYVNLLKIFICIYLDFFSSGKGGGGDNLVVKGVGLVFICLLFYYFEYFMINV